MAPTLLLAAGLCLAQPPAGVGKADVKRLADRLAQLDPKSAPKTDQTTLDAIKKFLDANPKLKEEVEQRFKDFQKQSPEKQRAALEEYQKTLDNPLVQDQLKQVLGEQPKKPAGTLPPPPPRKTPPAPPPPLSEVAKEPPGILDNQRLDKRGRPQPEADAPTPAPPPRTAGTAGVGGYEKFAKMWERNVGPLSDTPALKELATELLKGGSAGPNAGPLGDLMDAKTAESLLKGLPDVPDAGRWSFPELGGIADALPDALPQASVATPGGPSAGGLGAVVGVLLLMAVAVALFRIVPKLVAGDRPTAVPGLGPWPLDPRTVETRADLVRAFEYLSVLLNGDPARAYSHEAAAAALRHAVPAAANAAGPLADAYAVARYTPADVPIPAEVIAAARGHLCRLAGVPAP